MRKFFVIGVVLLLSPALIHAQGAFTGVQNSKRKGMVNAIMNPAELTNLTKKVEVSFFALDAGLSNNVYSFQDILKKQDQFNQILQEMDGPVNLRTELSVLGPSVGFDFGKWSFGFTSQAKIKADVIDLNADLSDALTNEELNQVYNEVLLDIPYNQRVNAMGWAEVGLMAGRSIWDNDNHAFSVGAHLRFLLPATYANFGINEINARLIQEETQISLTDATGEINISYDDTFENLNGVGPINNRWGGIGLRGMALDLGASYQLKVNDRVFLNTGISLRNLGSMNTGPNQINNTYTMNIPRGEFFRLDNLEGSTEEIEQQMINSGYFTIDRQAGRTKINLPQQLSAYVEWSPVKQFQVSLYAQKRINDENLNTQLTSPDLLVLTPRLLFSKLELYSPWMQHQVAGLMGGLGIQYGGFFIGSQSIITGLLADSHRIDAHLGLSWGF